MATAHVVDQGGALTGTLELPEAVFEAPVNEAVMHQALVRQLANARQGTHDTKNRSEVRGGGRKPWRQKGTGRARQGSIRAPQFAGGGIVFGPQPHGHRQDMPRKQRRLALRSALAAQARDGRIVVLEGFELEEPHTKTVVAMLEGIDAAGTPAERSAGTAAEPDEAPESRTRRVLLVLGQHNEVLERSARNLAEVRVVLASNLNVRDLLIAETVVFTRDAIEHVGEVLR
jgi:large subunit ribosomal protein L4